MLLPYIRDFPQLRQNIMIKFAEIIPSDGNIQSAPCIAQKHKLPVKTSFSMYPYLYIHPVCLKITAWQIPLLPPAKAIH